MPTPVSPLPYLIVALIAAAVLTLVWLISRGSPRALVVSGLVLFFLSLVLLLLTGLRDILIIVVLVEIVFGVVYMLRRGGRQAQAVPQGPAGPPMGNPQQGYVGPPQSAPAQGFQGYPQQGYAEPPQSYPQQGYAAPPQGNALSSTDHITINVHTAQAQGSTRRCASCGSVIDAGSAFCGECGSPVSAERV